MTSLFIERFDRCSLSAVGIARQQRITHAQNPWQPYSSFRNFAFRSQLLRLTLLTQTRLLVTRPKEAFMRGHPSQEISRENYVKGKQARMVALCAQIATEYDRDTFTRLIYELNDLLEGKAQRLDGHWPV